MAKALLLVTLTLPTTAAPALAAHLQPAGVDSVDGREIRYDNGTKYDGAFRRAVNAWNALGKVKLAADDVWHVCDLEVWDEAFPATVTFYGKWYYRSGTGTSDRIKMNKTLLDSIPLKGLRTGIIRRTMAHEFGHALGIDDHSDSKWIRKALMYKAAGGTNADIQTPQAHDKKDYNDRW